MFGQTRRAGRVQYHCIYCVSDTGKRGGSVVVKGQVKQELRVSSVHSKLIGKLTVAAPLPTAWLQLGPGYGPS